MPYGVMRAEDRPAVASSAPGPKISLATLVERREVRHISSRQDARSRINLDSLVALREL